MGIGWDISFFVQLCILRGDVRCDKTIAVMWYIWTSIHSFYFRPNQYICVLQYLTYTTAIFEKRRSYGMAVCMSRHKGVNGYIFKVKFIDDERPPCQQQIQNNIPRPDALILMWCIHRRATNTHRELCTTSPRISGASKYKAFSWAGTYAFGVA